MYMEPQYDIDITIYMNKGMMLDLTLNAPELGPLLLAEMKLNHHWNKDMTYDDIHLKQCHVFSCHIWWFS